MPHTYGIGLGDYSNLLRTTARKHLKSYTADNNSFEDLDTLVRRDKIRFFKDCHFDKLMKAGRLIGLTPGNHLWEFADGTNDTQFLCQLAKVPYLDPPGFIRLRITVKGKTAVTLKLLCHHGDWSGGSSRAGGDLNAMENKALGFDFDIYIFSHTHRKIGYPGTVLTIPERGELRPIEKSRVFIRTGTFMAGYEPTCMKSYAQKTCMNPTALGYVTLEIKLERPYNAERFKTTGNRWAHDNVRAKFKLKY